ncbi:MAG: hypothetical protein WKF37_14955 [Bryobacteraceae bacterium]
MRNTLLKTLVFISSIVGVHAAPVYSGTVTTHAFNVNGGGRFTGTVNGILANLWCVDNQLHTSIPDAFSAYRTQINNAVGLPGDNVYDTRYENATFHFTLNNSTQNADFRYRMAAYLVTQYDETLARRWQRQE